MAEKLYFIRTDSVAAKINLYNKLCGEEENILPFLKEDRKTSLELIKKKIVKDVKSLSKEELSNICNWFTTRHVSDPEEGKIQLFIHGIDIFYEISEPSDIKDFHHLLSDYEEHSKASFGHIPDSEEFTKFIIYGLMYTGIGIKTQGPEKILFDFLKSSHPDLFVLAKARHDAEDHKMTPSERMYLHFENLYERIRFYKGPLIII